MRPVSSSMTIGGPYLGLIMVFLLQGSTDIMAAWSQAEVKSRGTGGSGPGADYGRQT